MGRHRLDAVPVASAEEVIAGPPGAFAISEDRSLFYLRCPCGRCQKVNTLSITPGKSQYTWRLSGRDDRPSLTPSIHWMERDGRRTHWHGWLKKGVFEG